MRSSVAFLGKFLVLASILFGLWSFGGLGDWYARAVVTAGNPLVWTVTGFRVTRIEPGRGGPALTIARGADVAPLPLKPREAFSGIIPFLALVGAAVGVPVRKRLRASGLGLLILFGFHIGLLVVSPFFTGGPQGNLSDEWARRVNVLVDVFYGFYGLVGFAALPFLLWFWLGRDEASTADVTSPDA